MAPRKKMRGRKAAAQTTEEYTIKVADATEQRTALADLWRKGELCDVTVVVGGEEFPAHRNVLAAGLTYMRARFSLGMRDAKAQKIEVAEMEAEVFRTVIECIYTGEVRVTEASLAPVLLAASRLEVVSLLRAGALWLKTRLTAETCLPTWILAEQLQRPAELGSIEEACVLCAAHDFGQVSAREEWTSLDASQISRLLAVEEIIADEIDVFRVLTSWARARKPAAVELGGLLKLVRFNSIPAEELSEVCKVDPIFAAHPDSRELLCGAFEFHALPEAKRPPSSDRKGCPLTWNPHDKHEWVMLDVYTYRGCMCTRVYYGHEDDLQKRRNGMVRAPRPWRSGRHYWTFQFEIHTIQDEKDSYEHDGFPSIGVVAGDVGLGGDEELIIGGAHGRGWGYHLSHFQKVHASRLGAKPEAASDMTQNKYWFGLLLDMDAGTLSLFFDDEIVEGSTHENVRGVGPLFAAMEVGTASGEFIMLADFGAESPVGTSL